MSVNFIVSDIGKTVIGIHTTFIKREMPMVYSTNAKSLDGLKSNRRLTRTVVRFAVFKNSVDVQDN